MRDWAGRAPAGKRLCRMQPASALGFGVRLVIVEPTQVLPELES